MSEKNQIPKSSSFIERAIKKVKKELQAERKVPGFGSPSMSEMLPIWKDANRTEKACVEFYNSVRSKSIASRDVELIRGLPLSVREQRVILTHLLDRGPDNTDIHNYANTIWKLIGKHAREHLTDSPPELSATSFTDDLLAGLNSSSGIRSTANQVLAFRDSNLSFVLDAGSFEKSSAYHASYAHILLHFLNDSLPTGSPAESFRTLLRDLNTLLSRTSSVGNLLDIIAQCFRHNRSRQKRFAALLAIRTFAASEGARQCLMTPKLRP